MPPPPAPPCARPHPSARTGPRARAHGGFSLVEVALAIAILGTVVLGMLAMLSTGARFQAEARQNTLAILMAGQVVESLKAFQVGHDDAMKSQGKTLLDEFLPFSFAAFPAEDTVYVIGFDTEGNKCGTQLSADYEEGTSQPGVAYLARFEGRPVALNPGLTLVKVRIEFPADLPKDRRKTKEFETMIRPGATVRSPVTEGGGEG